MLFIAGILQVAYLAGAINSLIQVRTEGVPMSSPLLANQMVSPCLCNSVDFNVAILNVMFVRLDENRSERNHIIPLHSSNESHKRKKMRTDPRKWYDCAVNQACTAKAFNACTSDNSDDLVQCKNCGCYYHTGCVQVSRHKANFSCCDGEPDVPMSKLG